MRGHSGWVRLHAWLDRPVARSRSAHEQQWITGIGALIGTGASAVMLAWPEQVLAVMTIVALALGL